MRKENYGLSVFNARLSVRGEGKKQNADRPKCNAILNNDLYVRVPIEMKF